MVENKRRVDQASASLVKSKQHEHSAIDEPHRTRAEVEAAQAWYFNFYDLAPIGYFTLNAQGLIADVNLTGADFLGLARSTLIDQSLAQSILPEDRAFYTQQFRHLFETGEQLVWEMRIIRPDGTHIWVRMGTAITQESAHGAPVCRAVMSDITERKRAEASLRESETRFRQVWETTTDALVLSDAAGIVLAANPAYVQIYGYTLEQLIGQSFAIIFPETTRALAVAHYKKHFVSDEIPSAFESVIRRADGETRTVESRVSFLTEAGQRTAMLSTIRDITERKRVEEALRANHAHLEATLSELRQTQTQLVQQERLVAVGQLAAGIAHDFNNILSVITLQVQRSLHTSDLPAALHRRLKMIEQQSSQAAGLVQQILDFGRRAVLQTRPLDLAAFLAEQVELLRHTIPEHIRIDLVDETAVCIIKADSTRIQQIVTNLAINARDAMPYGGKLQIHLAQLQLTAGEAPPLPDMQAGIWIRLTVSDDGTGIPQTVLPHIFEPFYTTKEPTKGTGLGLAQVYGIVKQHQGHITVATQADTGTTFTIYLPAIAVTPARPPSAQNPQIPSGQGKTILVVEDNASLRESVMDILEMLGYHALSAANGVEALAILDQQVAVIDAVLSDLLMPEMGGAALFHALRARGLTLPMLMVSGHPMEIELQALQAQGLAGWLLKPIEIQQLATTLARLLHKGAPVGSARLR